MRAIKSCKNSKAFGHDKLSIFHLKHLGSRAIEYITALFNLSVTTCQLPTIWKSSFIIHIPKPGHDTQGTSYRVISLLCTVDKGLETLILHTFNKYLRPAPDQPSFRPEHSTTSAPLQLTQRTFPVRTVCVAVDLSAAFDTTITTYYQRSTDHSSLRPRAMALLLSKRKIIQDLLQRCKVSTGLPQGSKLSPSLFSFYIADRTSWSWGKVMDLLSSERGSFPGDVDYTS